MHNGITGYFAGNEEVAYRLRDKGVPSEAIRVTGIPVMAEFGCAPDRAACAAELGIDPVRMTLLLMGGGAGLGKLEQTAERLMHLDRDFQLIVMGEKTLRHGRTCGCWKSAIPADWSPRDTRPTWRN